MWVTPAFGSLENWTRMSKEQRLGSGGVREYKKQGLHHGFRDGSFPSHSANHFFGTLSFSFYKQTLGSSFS